MKYKTSADFRRALDDRLRQGAQVGEDLARLQRRVAYERFLARLFAAVPGRWVLKGGYALELRLGGRARATKDLDFNAPPGSPQAWLEEVRDAADLDLGDFFSFTVEEVKQGDLRGPPAGGQRFRVRTELPVGTTYATFLIDVGHGDVLHGGPDALPARVDLDFAGLPRAVFATYPLGDHFAEKLHALTRPRASGQNTRVKDLVDLSLLTEDLGLAPSVDLLETVRAVFARYDSHVLPDSEDLRAPPPEWTAPFAAMTRELGHGVTSAPDAHARLVAFLGRCFELEVQAT